MEMLEHIKARRTIRKFKPDPIPERILDEVFEAAMWAPSHANVQPWDFVVVGPEAHVRNCALRDVIVFPGAEIVGQRLERGVMLPGRAGFLPLAPDDQIHTCEKSQSEEKPG